MLIAMDASTWAANLAMERAKDAVDAACSTRSGEERLAREGREALFGAVPLTIGGDYPDGTDDDWCHAADLAYAAAVRAWRQDRNEGVCAARSHAEAAELLTGAGRVIGDLAAQQHALAIAATSTMATA